MVDRRANRGGKERSNGSGPQGEDRMTLSAAAVAEVQRALDAAVPEVMSLGQQPMNVVGLGVGVKTVGGVAMGEPALAVLVSQKVPEAALSEADRVKPTLAGMQTDVQEVGWIQAQVAARLPRAGTMVPLAGDGLVMLPGTNGASVEELLVGEALLRTQTPSWVAPQALAKRVRPAQGGYSVGHFAITAGTIATCVYDILPGGSTNPPAPGSGIPRRYYILSNNHVLANSNNANLGDPVLQPGPYDGGTGPADVIATLSRYVPITFEPPIPRAQHRNLVDAAIAEGQFHDLSREIYWSGYVRGWRQRNSLSVGDWVKKTGRTTSFTTGRVTAINATIDVGYGGGRVARFVDQIVTTNISAPGDSGSLVTDLDNFAVGLLYAGSSVATILNHIEYVRSLLGVEVGEQIGP